MAVGLVITLIPANALALNLCEVASRSVTTTNAIFLSLTLRASSILRKQIVLSPRERRAKRRTQASGGELTSSIAVRPAGSACGSRNLGAASMARENEA